MSKLVPKLRFKADDGSEFPEWKEKRLVEVLESKSIKQVPSGDVPLMAFIARKGVADKGERYDRSFLVKNDDKKYKKTDYNDFIYSSNNLDVGSIGLNKYGSAVISDVYEIFSFKQGYIPDCINLLIQCPKIMARILSFRQGCLYGQYRIYASDFLSVKSMFPSLPEQRKIASFLSAIDDIITTTEAELNAWEKRKKGVMQKLFSQEVRFKADDGSDFPDWEEKTLGDLGTFLKGAPLSKSDITDEGTPLILYGELYTTYAEVAYSIARRTDKKVTNKFYSKVGDVVIPTSGETPEEISTATCVMKDGVILAGDLYIYRPTTNVDGRILSYLLNHQVDNAISRIAQGKSVVHVQSKELERIHVIFPSSPIEQRKIVDCLASLDDVIAKVKDELDAWCKLKKSLLQQMFV